MEFFLNVTCFFFLSSLAKLEYWIISIHLLAVPLFGFGPEHDFPLKRTRPYFTCLTRFNATKHFFVDMSWYPTGPISQSAQIKYFLFCTVFENPIFSKVNISLTVQKFLRTSHSVTDSLFF